MKLLSCLMFLTLTVRAEIRNDIEFSRPNGEALTMDVHIPSGVGPFAGVILVHGGGWSAGDKQAAFVKPLFDPLDRSGLVWFTINYRLARSIPIQPLSSIWKKLFDM